MPIFEHQGVALHYEEHGHGFPVLLFAPGGMRSNASFWQRAPYDPIKELAQEFRVIVMDQRNAGHSVASISPDDGWPSYTRDHLALLDHLSIWRCHLLGGCIGGAFALRLASVAPQLVAAAVLQQPIGLSTSNRDVFYKLFDDWAAELAPRHSEATPAMWQAFRERMYGTDFVFSVSREETKQVNTPLLVLMGNDVYHPSEISREIAALAPHAELVEQWKEPPHLATAVARVRSFLREHTPA
ncbi:MAG: alpha/beta hydrolase [Polyangiales bacterium]